MHTYVHRTSIHTEYTVLKTIHEVAGNHLEDRFTYYHFRAAWYSYLNLLDIDYNSGFVCPICGQTPQLLVMDGTSIAFRKELDSWKSIFQTNIERKIIKIGR